LEGDGAAEYATKITSEADKLRTGDPENPVRARVADEHVVGIVRHVGPVPTNPVGTSLLAGTHAS